MKLPDQVKVCHTATTPIRPKLGPSSSCVGLILIYTGLEYLASLDRRLQAEWTKRTTTFFLLFLIATIES